MVVGVIPARYQSTRLPFKLLKDLCGKPLIQWTWESAKKAKFLDRLIIACDDARIEEAARKFKADVVLTSPRHSSGTDRIAEAVRDMDAQIVVNIQADEPLIQPVVIDHLVRQMLDNREEVMATVRKKIDDPQAINSPAVVKVVCDRSGYALYFSRFPIPYYRDRDLIQEYYKHIGLYAYTKDFLYTFKNLPASRLEAAEKLEQLRALEAGYKIKVIETLVDSVGVDTEEDLRAVEAILSAKSGV